MPRPYRSHATYTCVVSKSGDANSEFITQILAGYKLSHVFPPDRIFTNPAKWTAAPPTVLPPAFKSQTASAASGGGGSASNEWLSVSYHHNNKWCSRCPLNLCKGKVLTENILSRHGDIKSLPPVMYVGDGGGDVCPALCLRRSIDVVFGRNNYAMHKKLSNLLPTNTTTAAAATAATTNSAPTTAAAATKQPTFSEPPLRATLKAWADGNDVAAGVDALLSK